MDLKEQSEAGVTYRMFASGEDFEITECLRDEYGESYDAKDYYRAGYFTERTTAGAMQIVVAALDGSVVGFLVMKRHSMFDGQIELSTMVVKKALRGRQLSEHLLHKGIELVEQMDICAYFGHSQVFHDISIKKLCAYGLVPCGYILSMFIAENLKHSFGVSQSRKLPWAITLKPVKKRDAGRLFVPACHSAITANIYDHLGVRYQLDSRSIPASAPFSTVETSMYEQENTLRVQIKEIGADLAARVEQAVADCPKPLLTVNIWLNVNLEHAVWAYEQLAARGFFFTGYQPLAQGAEYLILHHPMEVAICFADFVPFEPIAYVLDYIKNEYQQSRQNRCGGQYEKEH